MRSVSLALVTLLAVLPPAQGAPKSSSLGPQHLTLVDLKKIKGPVDMKLLREWVALVEAHQPSVVDDAVKTVASWPAATLAQTLNDVSELAQMYAWWHAQPFESSAPNPVYRERSYIRTPPVAGAALVVVEPAPVLIDDVFPVTKEDAAAGHLNRLLLRGVLLQTDVALYVMHTPAMLLRQRIADPNSTTAAVGVSDGEVQAVVDSGPYWSDARFLLEAIDANPSRYAAVPRFELVMPDPTSEPLVSFWYRAVSATLCAEAQWANAAGHLARGLELFPADDRLVFDGGVLHEVMASSQAQEVGADLVRSGGMPGFSGRAVELGLAADLLGRVVEHDPTIAEAHLHYGRVLSMAGRHHEALAELIRARDGLTDPMLCYYALLLLGREQAVAGDAVAAHEGYVQAAALFPHAQSPHLADSLIARRDGDVQAAAGGLTEFFVGPQGTDPAADPWWQYERSHSRDGKALMAAMRAALSAAR